MFQKPKDAMYYASSVDQQAAENAEYLQRLKELQDQSIGEQVKFFLQAFVMEFAGSFETVLNEVDEFKSFLKGSADGQLDEIQAHYFLEKRGETHTAIEFREKMRQIDLDFNKRISITEWLVFKYKKTLKGLFTPPPKGAVDPKFLKALNEAIEKHEAVHKAKAEKEAKTANLEALVKSGGPGASKAKVELMGLKGEDPAKHGASAIDAIASKLKAQRELKAAKPVDPFEVEQQRLAEEKKKKEQEEKAKKDESRARLAARSKMWS